MNDLNGEHGMGVALSDMDWEDEEFNLSDCAYYLGIGTCSHGCREEPSCMTDMPSDGWPVIERHPCSAQGLRALRLQRRTANWLGWLTLRPYPDHLKTYVSKYAYHPPSRHEILRWMNTADTAAAPTDEAVHIGRSNP